MGLALLLASAVFFLAGLLWIAFVLAWHYPWLLQLMFFFLSTLAFFGMALLCMLLYLGQALCNSQGGLLATLPRSAGFILSLSVFELIDLLNRRIMMPLYDWIRVVLMVVVDLDEKDRREILAEMNPDFRRKVFQRTILQLLPEGLQVLLIGGGTPESHPCSPRDRGDDEQHKPYVAATAGDSPSSPFSGDKDAQPSVKWDRRRSLSVNDLLTAMRSAEGASQSSKDSMVMQKIVAGKVTDQSMWLMSQGVARQYEEIRCVVNSALEAVSTPPQNRMLAVPWYVIKWELMLAQSVVTRVTGYQLPLIPRAESEKKGQ